VALGESSTDQNIQTLSVSASGVLAGVDIGLNVFGFTKRVVNFGEISAAYNAGIVLTGEENSLTSIRNFGTISGGINGIKSFVGAMNLLNTGTITGQAAIFALNSVADVVTNRGSMVGSIVLGGGDNELTNHGRIDGEISTGDAKDFVRNTGGSISGDITLGNGDNQFRNTGDFVGTLTFGNGSDLVVNRSGTMGGEIDMGGGFETDRIVNRGVIEARVFFVESNDLFDNRRGTVTNLVSMAGGDDFFDNRGGIVESSVAMGTGNDTFDNRGGTVVGGISLFDGSDRFIAGTSAQTVDGGLGIDTLDFSAFGSLTYNMFRGADQPGIPADSTFSRFENVVGSFTGTNVLTGNTFANVLTGGRLGDTLDGGNGDDELRGLAGNDTLIGRAGVDRLFGDNGDDVLNGGAGQNRLTGGADADRFVFDATRNDLNTITDFERGIDKIDLSLIDALPRTSGNQAFTFIGEAAIAASGQVRAFYRADLNQTIVAWGVQSGANILISVVALDGQHALQASDFIL
jgi:Ca2+-binding RTX toxin-like protein